MTKILLVEDDKSLREIYGVRLLAEGYDIVSAGDGEEALAMAIKDRPDLILSDVMMPKISGFDMLDILRSTTETKNIKVIMMTALSSEEQRQRGVALGADRYLVKSQVGIEDVVRTVHEVLSDAPVSGQKPLVSPRPAAPANPAPRPNPPSASTPPTTPTPQTSTPVQSHTAPVAPQPYIAAPQQTESTLPQPTAPFSTPRPGNLADRIIQPLTRPDSQNEPNFNELMDKELASVDQAPTPASDITPPTAPAPQNSIPAPTPIPSPAQESIPGPSPVAPSVSTAPTPIPAPTMPTPPQTQTQATPHPEPSGLEFEEIPRPEAPQQITTPAPTAPTSAPIEPTPQAPAPAPSPNSSPVQVPMSGPIPVASPVNPGVSSAIASTPPATPTAPQAPGA